MTTATITVADRVRQVGVTPPVIRPIAPLVVTGSGGSAATPAEVAMVVSWSTALGGPRYRGRTYLGPLASVAIASTGLLNATLTATVASAAAALRANLAANSLPATLVVYSRKFGTTQAITGSVVNTEPDTQRRRGQ